MDAPVASGVYCARSLCTVAIANGGRGLPELAHELDCHDGRLELSSRVVGLHRLLEVAQIVVPFGGAPLCHPRVLQQLRRPDDGAFEKATNFKMSVCFYLRGGGGGGQVLS